MRKPAHPADPPPPHITFTQTVNNFLFSPSFIDQAATFTNLIPINFQVCMSVRRTVSICLYMYYISVSVIK